MTVKNLISHVELEPLFDTLMPAIIQESDRGAVLLGLSQIDLQLTNLFKTMVPESISNNQRKDIFNVTGPFGGLSSKLHIALVCRILPTNLVSSIHKLRKIRNIVAHQTETFDIKLYEVEFFEAYNQIGKNTRAGVIGMGLDMMIHSTLNKMLGVNSTSEPMFSNMAEAKAYLRNSSAIKGNLEAQVPKWYLATAVCLICGLILNHRDKILDGVGPEDTLYKALKNVSKRA